MLKNISITLYNFKYILYYVHVCTAVIRMNRPTTLQYFRFFAGKSTHFLCRFIIPLFYVPVYHLVSHWLECLIYSITVHTTRVCKYQQLKHHVHICIDMLPLYKDWSWGICIIQLQAIKFKILARAWRDIGLVLKLFKH